MLGRIKVSTSDPTVRRIMQSAYPQYRGRKISLVAQSYPLDCRSYWDGGSRDYYTFVKLADFSVAQMPAQSGFDRQIRGADSVMLPAGIACAVHSYFCGKDVGITIYLNPENMAALLPASIPRP